MTHRVDYVWQECDDEVSYRCTCGHISKHQEFGSVPRCPDQEDDDDR